MLKEMGVRYCFSQLQDSTGNKDLGTGGEFWITGPIDSGVFFLVVTGKLRH